MIPKSPRPLPENVVTTLTAPDGTVFSETDTPVLPVSAMCSVGIDAPGAPDATPLAATTAAAVADTAIKRVIKRFNSSSFHYSPGRALPHARATELRGGGC